MSSSFPQALWDTFRDWWREQSHGHGALRASSLLLKELGGFVRDSTPERRRSRYGDMEYDWEHHVNTSSGTVRWRERLLGLFHSAYQPTDPAAFREMMAALPIDVHDFTFIDLGSGKGRTLLMASEYPFQKIIGVEVIAELHRAAEKNIAIYRGQTSEPMSGVENSRPPAQIETLCLDARNLIFPDAPLVIYLFNPLPEAALRRTLRNLEESWRKAPREIWIVYHNPLLEGVLMESGFLTKASSGTGYALFRLTSSQTQ